MAYANLTKRALIPLTGYGLFVVGMLLFVTRSGLDGYAGPVNVKYLPPLDVKELDARFEAVDYTWPPSRITVPRLVLRAMPADMGAIDDAPTRKAVFLRAVLPMVMIENRRIRMLRSQVRRTLADGLPPGGSAARLWLRRIADRYRVKGNLDDRERRTALMRRIDVVPRPLALAQAAIESGWGTSRFAQQGNALFGLWTWGEHAGLVPRSRATGATHRVRRFSDLRTSVRAYLHHLNTGSAYQAFRRHRAALRRAGRSLEATALAEDLTRYSARGTAYVNDLKAMMNKNDLHRVASLRLCDLRCVPHTDTHGADASSDPQRSRVARMSRPADGDRQPRRWQSSTLASRDDDAHRAHPHSGNRFGPAVYRIHK